MALEKRLCIYCPYFDMEQSEYNSYGSQTGSDYTAGGPFCTKGHWRMSNEDATPADWRKTIEKALTCEDFVSIED